MEETKKEQLVLNMVNFYILFEKAFTALAPEIAVPGITPLLSRMLNEIHLLGRSTSKEIGERLNLSVPNTSRGVNVLYKMGYIEKRQCTKDRRITYLTLSMQGLSLVNQFIVLYQERFFEKLNVLSEQEVEELNSNFETIKKLFIKINQNETTVNTTNQRKGDN